jgi:integrase
MRTRGTGSIFQPKWKDPKTGETRTAPALWIKYHCRGTCGQSGCQGVHREASGFTRTEDRDESRKAERLLRQRLGEVDAGRLIAPVADKTTFADLAAMLTTDYAVNGRKSLERAAISIAHLREFWGDGARATTITTDRVSAYIAARQEATAAPATIRNELAALRRMFTLAVRARKVAASPYIESIEVRNTRTGFFEQEDFEAVRAQLPEDLQPVATFAYLTGWRKSEILTLRWANVDVTAGVVRLEPGTTKNDEGREFPFALLPPLGELLDRQRAHTKAVEKATGRVIPPVFHRQGRPIKDYYGAWRKACVAAGLGHVERDAAGREKLVAHRMVHDFRRTAVRRLERAGVSRSVAMKLTGHKTETVYRRYAIVAPADLRDGVAKLAASFAEPQQPTTRRRKVMAIGEARGSGR